MSGRERDDGLSEVIGFILIIGLLVIIASLYMTYMVPAQGREAEIQHMDYIKQQFLDYKINTDALWINNAVGTAITQSIRLGTEQQETSGSFAGFGIMKPVGSTGTLRINPDSIADNFTIGITGAVFASDNYTGYSGSKFTYVDPHVQTTFDHHENTNHYYLIFSTNRKTTTESEEPEKISYINKRNSYGFTLSCNSCTGDSQPLTITIEAVPQTDTMDYNWINEAGTALEAVAPSSDSDEYYMRYNTSLKLSYMIGDNYTMGEYTVYPRIESGKDYYIDLYDPAYAINSRIIGGSDLEVYGFDNNVDDTFIDDSFSINFVGTNLTDIKKDDELINILPGAMEYQSDNKYYRVQESFIYQMGGEYVKQVDGSSPLVLPPISARRMGGIDYINITAVRIINKEPQSISGGSQVQITTTVNNSTHSTLMPNRANAQAVNFTVSDSSTPEYWQNVFNAINYTASRNGVDNILVSSSPPMISFYGENVTGTTDDIALDITYVNLTVDLESVGKAISAL